MNHDYDRLRGRSVGLSTRTFFFEKIAQGGKESFFFIYFQPAADDLLLVIICIIRNIYEFILKLEMLAFLLFFCRYLTKCR